MPDGTGMPRDAGLAAGPTGTRGAGMMDFAAMERTTIGVVDDDAAVRRGLERLLGACGYHVENIKPRDGVARK